VDLRGMSRGADLAGLGLTTAAAAAVVMLIVW
jgi:hypothetical protein